MKNKTKKINIIRMRNDYTYIELRDIPDIYGIRMDVAIKMLRNNNINPIKKSMKKTLKGSRKIVFYLRSDVNDTIQSKKTRKQQIESIRLSGNYIEGKDIPATFNLNRSLILSRIYKSKCVNSLKIICPEKRKNIYFYLLSDIQKLLQSAITCMDETTCLKSDDRYIKSKQFKELYNIPRCKLVALIKSNGLTRYMGFYLRSEVENVVKKYNETIKEVERMLSSEDYTTRSKICIKYDIKITALTPLIHRNNIHSIKMSNIAFYLKTDIVEMMKKYNGNNKDKIKKLRMDENYVEVKNMCNIYNKGITTINGRIRLHRIKPYFKALGGKYSTTFYLRSEIDDMMNGYEDEEELMTCSINGLDYITLSGIIDKYNINNRKANRLLEKIKPISHIRLGNRKFYLCSHLYPLFENNNINE